MSGSPAAFVGSVLALAPTGALAGYLFRRAALRRLARGTPGFSGADLENLLNEAALLAVRRESDTVAMADLELAIERVVAGDDVAVRKPDPAHLTACLAGTGLAAGATTVVGDSPNDVLAAHGAGMRSVAVSWGLVARERLVAARPAALVDDVGTLARELGLDGMTVDRVTVGGHLFGLDIALRREVGSPRCADAREVFAVKPTRPGGLNPTLRSLGACGSDTVLQNLSKLTPLLSDPKDFVQITAVRVARARCRRAVRVRPMSRATVPRTRCARWASPLMPTAVRAASAAPPPSPSP